MSIIYRPRKDIFYKPITKIKKFPDELSMKKYIIDYYKNFSVICTFSVDDIIINSNSFKDKITGWKDARNVYVTRNGDKDYIKLYGHPVCIGVCATNNTPGLESLFDILVDTGLPKIEKVIYSNKIGDLNNSSFTCIMDNGSEHSFYYSIGNPVPKEYVIKGHTWEWLMGYMNGMWREAIGEHHEINYIK